MSWRLKNGKGWIQGAAAGVFFFVLTAGCAVSRKVTLTPRSSIEQRLLVRSLERALAQIDTRRFKGKRIALDVYGLTGDKDFAKELLMARLRERGMRFAGEPDKSDLRLKVFFTALGVDRGERLLGIPAFAAPVVNLPVPEIALFKTVRNRGRAEIQIFAFAGDSGDFVQKSPVAVGESKYDDYTVLIVINFNLNDLDDEPEEKAQGGSS